MPMTVGTTDRFGTRDGPAAIRRASRMLTDGDHPAHRVDPARMNVSGIGDFGLAPGGEHSLTLPLPRAPAQRLGRKVAPGGVTVTGWLRLGHLL